MPTSTSALPLNSSPKDGEAELQALAATHTVEAFDGLVRLARNRKTPAHVRLGALREILDRAHGKPAQAVTGRDGGPITAVLKIINNYVAAADSLDRASAH